ncbi:chaplin family protein [Streptomyces tritici]|uniref:chaplin family protein n=1 Tax=Streptomyces tritici TaxID=2054410 RepID=UPI003AEFA6D7
MRQVTRKGLITVAAAGGVFAALGGGYAHADANAGGAATNSPGVASGNSVQVPVHVPVNACGNTVSVVGVLNPAFGNSCANVSGPASEPGGGGSGSSADGQTSDSPGVGSGNNVQVPVDVPVNACGNSVDVIGVGNSAYGNDCDNGVEPTPPGEPQEPGNPGEPNNPGNPGEPQHPGEPGKPAHPGEPGTSGGHNNPGTRAITPPQSSGELAETGAGIPLGLLLPAGAGALIGGAILYRRARVSA